MRKLRQLVLVPPPMEEDNVLRVVPEELTRLQIGACGLATNGIRDMDKVLMGAISELNALKGRAIWLSDSLKWELVTYGKELYLVARRPVIK